MFLPDGSEYSLRLPNPEAGSSKKQFPVHCVVGNRDRSLFVAATSSTVYIILAHPQLLLCTYHRTKDDVDKKGEYRKVYWRHDSSAICFTTSKNCMLLYRIEVSDDKQSFSLNEAHEQHLKRSLRELFVKDKCPQTALYLSVIARLDSPATCVVPLREELFVCLRNGWLHRISWEGVADQNFCFHISEVPFAYDQLQSKTEHLNEAGVHVIDIAYAPLIGGFCVVLSSGSAALLTSPTSKFLPKELLGVWALQLSDAVCTATNHKYRLVLYGCKNGDIAAYQLDDANGSMTCAYRVTLKVTDGPELSNCLSEVRHLECYMQGTGFAGVWAPLSHEEGRQPSTSRPIIAIYSSFGTQLWCSLESTTDRCLEEACSIRWVDWGPEGLSLWMAGDDGLHVLPLSHSTSVNNIGTTERIIFLSSNKIILSTAKEREQAVNAPHSIWLVLQIPFDYLFANWPIRLVELDDSGHWLVAAGSRGFVHHNLLTGKWRMFGNESQEKEILVTGGLSVWEDYAVIACFDIDCCREELRFYPLEVQLSDHFCIKHALDSRILLLSRRGDKLITFDMSARIFVYEMSLNAAQKNRPSLINLERCAEIRIKDLVPHAACVLSIEAFTLNHDSTAAKFCTGVDTILLNISGNLIMLNPSRKEKSIDESDDDEDDHFQLSQPMLIASYVEHIWFSGPVVPFTTSYAKPHLTQALWLNCGAKGMKVWLPLFTGPRNSLTTYDSSRSFISKRIMLPFELSIPPLVICSKDCLAVGVESTLSFSPDKGAVFPQPSYSLHRKSEVFLHHLLRQLLKRNLGVYALEIAATCTHLPYFGHALELLLHNVLEEEATSSEPIPDPLLPRIVAFIQEFPNYLQTVAHCARKTELALWQALFAVTGHPKELFEKCISDRQLETAVSFLIILQNMESSSASQEHAVALLEEALSKREWLIARDIVRFLRAIDPADIGGRSRTSSCQKTQKNIVNMTSRRYTTSDSAETDTFVFGSYNPPGMLGRPKLSQQDTQGGSPALRRESVGAGGQKKVSKTRSADSPPSPASPLFVVSTNLDDVLQKHAAQLLEDYSIRDLGAFAAYLEFDVHSWLENVRHSLCKVSDYGLALMRLHAQFKWPYPLVSQCIVEQLSKQIESIKTSQSNTSLESLQSSSTAVGSAVGGEEKQQEIPSVSVTTNSPYFSDTEDEKVAREDSRKASASSVSADSASSTSWEGFHKMCGEMAARGTQESELELKYMLDVMHDAKCADWTFLLCLLRRDFAFLSRHFTKNYLTSCGPKADENVLAGIKTLTIWASNNCFGYQTVIEAFRKHVHYITKTDSSIEIKQKKQWRRASLSSIESETINEQSPMLNGNLKIKTGQGHIPYDSPKGSPVQNGSVKTTTQSEPETSAALNIVKKTFTPPRDCNINSSKLGNAHNVVSNVVIQNDERCRVM